MQLLQLQLHTVLNFFAPRHHVSRRAPVIDESEQDRGRSASEGKQDWAKISGILIYVPRTWVQEQENVGNRRSSRKLEFQKRKPFRLLDEGERF